MAPAPKAKPAGPPESPKPPEGPGTDAPILEVILEDLDSLYASQVFTVAALLGVAVLALILARKVHALEAVPHG